MVSVIVPVYNAEKTIEKCVASILEQTVEKQIVLVNDGSQDGSLSVIQGYARQHENILVVDKPNGGVSSARNAGLAVSTGEFVTFIDSDDYYLTSDYISNMIHAASPGENIDLVITGFTVLNPSGKKCFEADDRTVSIQNIARDYLEFRAQNLMNSPCNKLFRRALIKTPFDERMKMGEDAVFVLNYLKCCRNVAFCSGCGYGYVFMSASSTAAFRKKTLYDIAQTNIYHEQILDFWKAFLPEQACADRYIRLRVDAVCAILTTYARKKGILAFVAADIKHVLLDKNLSIYKDRISELPDEYPHKALAGLIGKGSTLYVKLYCLGKLIKRNRTQ